MVVVCAVFCYSLLFVVEFSLNITSVFCMLIFRPIFDDAVASASTILWISTADLEISALGYAKAVLSQVNLWFLYSL